MTKTPNSSNQRVDGYDSSDESPPKPMDTPFPKYGRMPGSGSTPNRALALAPFSPKLAVTDHLLQGQYENRMDIVNVLSKTFLGGLSTVSDGMNTLAKTYAREDTQVIRAHLELSPVRDQGGNDVSLVCSARFPDRLSGSATTNTSTPSSQKKMPAFYGSNRNRDFHLDDAIELDEDNAVSVGESFVLSPTDAKASLAAKKEQSVVKVAKKQPTKKKTKTKATVSQVRRSCRLRQQQDEDGVRELLEGFGDFDDVDDIPAEEPWTCDSCGHRNPHGEPRCVMTGSVAHDNRQHDWNGPEFPPVCTICSTPIVPGAQHCVACNASLL